MAALDEVSLKRLATKYLSDFRKTDSVNARQVENAMNAWEKEKGSVRILDWWKEQDVQWIAALQSFVFWLWTTKKIEEQLFEETHNALTPVLSKSCSMPIVITTGTDEPLFEGGFIDHNFSFFHYKFSPANRGLLVEYNENPPNSGNRISLDFILDFLSFLAEKGGMNYLGFRQIQSRKWNSSETSLIHVGAGPEIRLGFPDYDFEQVELGLSQVEIDEKGNGVSIAELLHIRHRAILDSSPESKLITLWSFIEGYWGEDDDQDKLLTASELKKAKQGLRFLASEKYNKALNLLNKLKNKTRNDKIIEKIRELNCTKGWDDETIRQIHSLRSKFAHGDSMRPEEQDETNRLISFMLQIIDELITQQFSRFNIRFNS